MTSRLSILLTRALLLVVLSSAMGCTRRSSHVITSALLFVWRWCSSLGLTTPPHLAEDGSHYVREPHDSTDYAVCYDAALAGSSEAGLLRQLKTKATVAEAIESVEII